MFGLFRKKEVDPVIDTISELHEELQARIFDTYPLGRELDYMGVKIRITSHIRYRKGIANEWIFLPTIYPEIKCDYVNKSGQIEQISFDCQEVATWET